MCSRPANAPDREICIDVKVGRDAQVEQGWVTLPVDRAVALVVRSNAIGANWNGDRGALALLGVPIASVSRSAVGVWARLIRSDVAGAAGFVQRLLGQDIDARVDLDDVGNVGVNIGVH